MHSRRGVTDGAGVGADEGKSVGEEIVGSGDTVGGGLGENIWHEASSVKMEHESVTQLVPDQVHSSIPELTHVFSSDP